MADVKKLDGVDVASVAPTREQPEVRETLIAEVMAAHRLVAKAFSAIDMPFAGEDSIHEHERLEHELEHLVGRVVHLPESVEGVRWLQEWFDAKTNAMRDIVDKVEVGVTVQIERADGVPVVPFVLNADMAKGMCMGLIMARKILGNFPLKLSQDDPN